jgi:uncharacterized membrane protein YtjA (UPF0391 family)
VVNRRIWHRIRSNLPQPGVPARPIEEVFTMFLLRWALLFLLVAVIAAVFGFGNVAEGATDIAKVLFFIFLGLFVLLQIGGSMTYSAVARPSDKRT